MGYTYICLGGSVGRKKTERFNFFENIYNKYPTHKFHGLGVNDPKLIKSFPFYSVDSTSWLIGDKVGRIFNSHGVQIDAPKTMSSKEKFKINIEYLTRLE